MEPDFDRDPYSIKQGCRPESGQRNFPLLPPELIKPENEQADSRVVKS